MRPIPNVSSYMFIGQDVPLTKGLHAIFIRPRNAVWKTFLAWVMKWNTLWDTQVIPKLESEWNVNAKKPGGFTLKMPKSVAGRYFRFKLKNGKFTQVARKGWDESRGAFYFFALLYIVFGGLMALAFSEPLKRLFKGVLPGFGDDGPDLFMERMGDVAAQSAIRSVQNTVSGLTGGVVPAATTPTAAPRPNGSTSQPRPVAAPPKEADPTVERFTNPWLYGTLGVLLLFGTTFVRQTRGLARDVGSGVSSTRDAVRSDFGELQSDPGNPRGR